MLYLKSLFSLNSYKSILQLTSQFSAAVSRGHLKLLCL